MSDPKQCPNCGRKDSVFSKVFFLEAKDIEFINRYHEPKCHSYCQGEKCGYLYLYKYKQQLKDDYDLLISELNNIDLSIIPVITLPNPYGWEYQISEMVTAQTTTGTGAITEVFAQVADFMGEQSNRHNNKIHIATNLCKLQLRREALALNCNAVVGCDIDISTAGVGNGLIIVCMSGTAVKVANIDQIQPNAKIVFERINFLQAEIEKLSKN